MRKRIGRMGLLMAVCAAIANATDSLTVFKAGDTAKASEINSNFKLLWDRIAALSAENQGLKKSMDTLNQKAITSNLQHAAKFDSAKGRIASLESNLVLLPKGSITASMIPPSADGYLPNSDQSWLIAAGQSAINGVTIPDLRGVFLRGIDLQVTGGKVRAALDSLRTPGDYQSDTLKAHTHFYDYHAPVSNAQAGSSWTVSGASSHDRATSSSFGGTETRPKNVATYYYIKVK